VRAVPNALSRGRPSGEGAGFSYTPGRFRGLERESNGAIILAIGEILPGQDPRSLRVGARPQIELRGVVGEGQQMIGQEPLVAVSRALNFAPAARRLAGPDVQLGEQRERLRFAARCDHALEPFDRRPHLVARDFELGEMNVRRREFGQRGLDIRRELLPVGRSGAAFPFLAAP